MWALVEPWAVSRGAHACPTADVPTPLTLRLPRDVPGPAPLQLAFAAVCFVLAALYLRSVLFPHKDVHLVEFEVARPPNK